MAPTWPSVRLLHSLTTCLALFRQELKAAAHKFRNLLEDDEEDDHDEDDHEDEHEDDDDRDEEVHNYL